MNLKLIGSRLFSLYEKIEGYVVGIGGVFLVLMAIPPIHALLTLPEESIVALLGVELVLVLKSLHGIEKGITSLDIKSQLIKKGVNEVYPYIDALMSRRPRWTARRRGSVEVLGLSLYTAWPFLQGLLKTSTNEHCDITLCCLDPEYIPTNPTIRPEWAEHARANINEITNYVRANASDLKQRDIALRLHLYRFFPLIHGFRFDGEDILYSFLHCANDGRAAQPLDFYEHASQRDSETRSALYSELFVSWLDEAKRGREVLGSVATASAASGRTA
jgi:hypothetical protein